MKKIFTFLATAAIALGAYAEEAKVVQEFDATWSFYNYDEDEGAYETTPASSLSRTLYLYSDGTYGIQNGFDGDESDVMLTFEIKDDNIFFTGLETYYFYQIFSYAEGKFAYLCDGNTNEGEYSSFEKIGVTSEVNFFATAGAVDGLVTISWIPYTLQNSYDATWYLWIFDKNNNSYITPEKGEYRKLNLYDNGVYEIVNAFGSNNKYDVLDFIIKDGSVEFQDLKVWNGKKYIYYNESDYAYIYDGNYSSYYQDRGDNIWFWIDGTPGYGQVNLVWNEPTVVETLDGVWRFFNADNVDKETPDYKGERTLNVYSDGYYEIVDAFGPEDANDVLTFSVSGDNFTFFGLDTDSENNGLKYIFYNGEEYSYLYDSEVDGGDYSSYYKDENEEGIWFWISGDAGNGCVNFAWNVKEDTDGISSIEMQNASTEYFNLNGVRVMNPQNGIFIVRQGNKVTKQVIR